MNTPSPNDELDAFGCPIFEAPPPQLLEVGLLIVHDDFGSDHDGGCDRGPFDHSPPTSGPHFDAWQNCGFYSDPILDSVAVHSLEHGAVWIAYQSTLDTDDIESIKEAASEDSHLLASPYPDLKNPIVLSAWTRQVAVDAWDDPLVNEFLTVYRAGSSPTAPEAGASCSGAVGSPPDAPLFNYGRILAALK